VKLRVLLAAALLALVVPASALAHAELISTFPANGSVVARAPNQLRAVFDDVVRPGPGIEAVRNGGGSILAGKARVVNGRTLVIPLKPGARHGAFSVRWAIISDDGHLETGIVAFAVGKGSAPPAAALTASGSSPPADEVAWRWLLYAGLLGAVGISLFALAARPRDQERVALLLTAGAVLAAIGAGEEAHRIGLEARAGTALGATSLAAVAVATLAGAATLAPRLLRPALLGSLVLVLGPAFAGHAYDRGVNRLNVVADALHLGGAGAWVGALVGLVAFRDARRRPAVVLAAAGVVLLAATGVVRAVAELRTVSQLWDTSYGRALLVKTGILLVALVLGRLLATRIRRRAGAELALAGGIVVAVSFLVLLPPGRSIAQKLVRVSTAERSPQPPPPPSGSVVLAKEMGQLGVAVALEPARTTAIVLSPAGGGLDGLDVKLNGRGTESCGHGCYRSDAAPGSKVDVHIDRFGPPLDSTFDAPSLRQPAAALVKRIRARYKTLRSVFFLETLGSSPSRVLTSLWRLESPDRVEYQIPGGASGIVIGGSRWDRERPDATWEQSVQSELSQPAVPWATVANAHLVADDGATKTVTFVDPSTPAYFQVTVDSKTLLPRDLHMTASAHFMHDRFVRFNGAREIYPPR
jgi:copper transport protein